MSRKAAIRRPLAGIAVTAVAATALVLAPLNVTAADASLTPLAEFSLEINLDRVFNFSDSQPAFTDNGFMDDYAQAAVADFAACNGCSQPAHPVFTPANATSTTITFVEATGGPVSGRAVRLADDLYTYDYAQLMSSDTYGAVGLITKGNTTYAMLVSASFSADPDNETRVGTVKLPSHVYVGVPVAPVIAGFTPVPTTAYGYTWKSNGITVGNSATYTPTSGDVGKKLQVLVEDHNSGYSDAVASSPLSSKVLIGKVTGPPSVIVMGNRNVGQQLTVSNTGWSPNTPSAQWYRNGVAIGGATGLSYNQVAGDHGKHISVKLTGSASGYLSLTRSSPTNIATGLPMLSISGTLGVAGTPTFGQTVSAEAGTWGPGFVTLKYQWRADGAAIPGAKNQTFTIGAAQLHEQISVTISGTEAGYAPRSISTNPTPDVQPVLFTSAQTPLINGTIKAGQTVTASGGIWSPTATAFTYQWYLNGSAIPGATKSSYKIPAVDGGDDLSVAVIGTRSGYKPIRELSGNHSIAF